MRRYFYFEVHKDIIAHFGGTPAEPAFSPAAGFSVYNGLYVAKGVILINVKTYIPVSGGRILTNGISGLIDIARALIKVASPSVSK